MITRVKGSSIRTRDLLGYVNFTDPDIGAVGDGVTDNTAALVAAFATGLPVYVPPGTFISGPVLPPTGATIFGAGLTSVLKLKASSLTPLLTFTGAGFNLFNILFDGNKANQLGVGIHALSFSGATNTRGNRIWVRNTLGDGIIITGASSNISLNELDITGFVHNGITIDNGSNIRITHADTYSSDVVASPGDGISIAPSLVGNSLNGIALLGCNSFSNIGRGFSILGNGSKNVSNVLVDACRALSNTSHGFHGFTAQQLILSTNISRLNGGDGFRLEGDLVDSRVLNCIGDGNTTFGFREVTTGPTPNRNSFIYSVSVGNGTNTVTKVGANSSVITI